VSGMNRAGRRSARSTAVRAAGMRTAGVRTAGAIGAALLLAGCSLLGGGKEATPSVSAETVTPAATASPSPTMPAAARATSNAGAEAFVSHWFRAYSHATWERTSAELTPISDPTCVFCNNAKKTIEGLKANDRRVEGGLTTISNFKRAQGAAGTMRLDCSYDQAASSILDAAGSKLSTSKATKSGKMLVALKWTGKQWTVLEIVILT